MRRDSDRASIDEKHMQRCLQLAASRRGKTAPNPMVGCVIVDRRGAVIAEGKHLAAGKPHAEAVAIAALTRKRRLALAKGGTLYVNLEPCSHHGRTPPCVDAVIALGVARVVVGMVDPIRSHSGGVTKLHRAGVAVTIGVLRKQCEELNRGFVAVAKTGFPFVTAKAAITLDGKIATKTGDSKWITGEKARKQVMQMRAAADAVLVGIGTVLADDPRLTVRGVTGAKQPIKVVLDSFARTPLRSALFERHRDWKLIIAVAKPAAAEPQVAGRIAALRKAGAEVWLLPVFRGGRGASALDLTVLLSGLAQQGCNEVLVEGGSNVFASLFAASVEVDIELVLFVAPKAIGGSGARSWLASLAGDGSGISSLADALQFVPVAEPRVVGDDMVWRLRLRSKT